MSDDVIYHEILPPLHLQAHVKCIWRLSGPHVDVAMAEPIVPDGCVELVLNLADPFIRHIAGEGSHHQPRRLVAGQITRAVTIGPSGRMDLWGIRFHPWSAAAFFGVSGDELRDRFQALDEVQGSLDRDLADLEALCDDDARYHVIVSALTKQAKRIAPVDAVLPKLVHLVEQRHEPMSVAGLARHVGLSTRRVQLWFRDKVGLSPKQLLRIARFQRALALARARPTLSWSAVAAHAGYYDQAHLIHESNEIVGCTPSALLGRDSTLTDAFLVD
jgi:AraC-like DNA-binding protein